ncbi:MAG: GldG family protein [Granulosicoccus sp.]
MNRASRIHLILSLLLVATVLAVLWFTQRYTVAWDLTANQRHSLSPTTVAVLESSSLPVNLIAVLGPDPQQRQALIDLVARFQAIKPDISLAFINPETSPAQARALNAAPGGELILQTSERERRLQRLSERSLTSSFQQLMRDGDRDIAFITGHGERSPERLSNDDWQLMAERLAAIGLVSREISLVSEPYLDDSIDLLVIADPKLPYFPGEIASINDYVQRGGNLLWLSELPSGKDTGPGLDLLTANLGVDILPGTVIDTASQQLAADSPDFVLLDRFPRHPVTVNLTSPLLLPQAAAIAVTPLAGQIELPLLQTPESSWTEMGVLQGAVQFDANTDEIAGPLLLGVTIERQLASDVQRFAIIGDADFAASQFVGNGSNQSFTEALVLWLTGDSDEVDFVFQKAPDSELILDKQSIIYLSLLCLVLIPALLVSIALWVRWWRRKE